MPTIKLVLFDADGVLLDSLVPHLKICEDKNKEFGLGLRIPSPSELKAMARCGVRISPMTDFFMAVGFPKELAKKANSQYKRLFMRRYAPARFPQTDQMLARLHHSGFRMGIVTSNIRTNVVESLSQSMKYFDPDLIFSKDDVASSKAEAIIAAMAKAQVTQTETLYVGDQLADWEAAKAAGAKFLGVAFGWGLSEEDHFCPIVREVSDIASYVLGNDIRAH